MDKDTVTPDILLIGAITADIGMDGIRRPGGTAFYSAVTAARLGLDVGIVTRPRDDVPFGDLLDGVQTAWVEPPSTLSFRNIYQSGQRVQYIQDSERGVQALGLGEIPKEWTKAPMVHLAPVANEIEPSFAALFSESTVLATPQGWLRMWDAEGRIRFMPRKWGPEGLQNITTLVLSEEDLDGDRDQLRRFTQRVPIVVLTVGIKGCKLHFQGSWHDVPGFPTTEVDPTGAGDSFATAFLVHYHFNHDPIDAAIFANCLASFTVEGAGVSTIPTLHHVEQRLSDNGFSNIRLKGPERLQRTLHD